MDTIHYVGFDVHKKHVSYCVKAADGKIIAQGRVHSRREALEQWCQQQGTAWQGAMEATLFSGWIYDALKPYAARLEMANPHQLKAISAAKKKSDAIDAATLADLLRCNLLPSCYVAPPEIREMRRMLRYRTLVVQQSVRMKNRISGLLMEVGVEYSKEKLHGKGYFTELVRGLKEVPASVRQLLRYSRAAMEMFESTQKQLVQQLHKQRDLKSRVERLQSIPGVGEITALSWALEVGEVSRFGSISQAWSYCGLTAAFRESADKQQRGPISKQRNQHLQTVLIEAAKLAPRWNPALAQLHQRELQRGHRNRATLAVARKLVAYLMAVDRSQQPFQMPASAGADKAALVAS